MTGTDDDLNQRLAAVWADAVGSEVAANARPAQLRDGRLVVSTSSSAWAHTLQLMSPMVVDKLNERLGEGAVKKAVFRLAGWDPSAAGVTQHPAPGSSTAAAAPTPSAAPATAAKPLSPGQPPAAPRAAGPATSGLAAAPPAVPVPARAAPADGLTPEEVQALADLDRQPLDPTVKARIREAMQAGFVRTRQDFGRS
jgi:hypothetical protein